MSVHSFNKVQFIPATLDQAWDFFSNPANLPLITPPEMDFRIISSDPGSPASGSPLHNPQPFGSRLRDPQLPGSPSGERIRSAAGKRIYAGQVIEYKLRPLPGIRVYWMTEITHVQDKVYFVDEQRFGPYSLWHHQHHFKEIEGGIEMTDIVHYKVPFGFVGYWANLLFVQRQLDNIFKFRLLKVDEIFGSAKAVPARQ